MNRIIWKDKLHWSEDQLEEVRIAGYAYIRQGKYEIAIPFFEALVLLEPESAYDAQTLGALYLELNQPENSLKYLEKALKIEGDHGPTLINMAKAFFMLGKKDEGLKLAAILQNETDFYVANMAKALLLAYG